MKLSFSIIFCFFIRGILFTQTTDIITCEYGNIFRFNPQTCISEIICSFPNLYFNDIGFAPDGNLYALDKSLTIAQHTTLVKIDILNCTYEPVLIIPHDCRGLVFDINGTANTAGEDLYTVNLKTKSIIYHGNFINVTCSGDLFFYNGELYMTGYDQILETNGIYKLNSDDSPIIKPIFNSQYYMEAAIAITKECGLNSKVFGFSSLPSFKFVEIDMKNDTIIEICNTKHFSGATSVSEFLASDPECDLLLDLDRDNSSGVFPYDYQTTFDCFINTMPICDNDIYIHTSQTEGYDLPAIDSIVLILSGIKDTGYESLIANLLSNSITFSSKNDSTFILKSNVTVPDTVYRDALKAIRYRNSQSHFNRKRGYRTVKVRAYSDVKVSETATAYFFVSRRTYAGKKTSTFNFCDTLTINELSKKIETEEYGRWVPPFVSNIDYYDSQLDVQILYKHITNDSICGEDTALVVFHKLIPPTVNLVGDTSLCNGESINIQLQSDINALWNDGDTSKHKNLSIGKHYVEVTNAQGCKAIDSIEIKASQQKIEVDKEVYVCKGSKYLYNGIEYDAGQNFTVTIPSLNTCDTLYSIAVIESDFLFGTIDTFTCDNSPIFFNNIAYQIGDTIKIIKQNEKTCDSLITLIYKNSTPETITISSLKDTICAGDFTTIEINGGANYLWNDGITYNERMVGAGFYHITVTDARGCKQYLVKEIFNYTDIEYNLPSTVTINKDEIQELIVSLVNGTIENIESDDSVGLSIIDNSIKITGSENKVYSLTITDENGCKYYHELTVLVKENTGTEIIFANIISPTSNTANNLWSPILPNGYQLLSFSIYDRWGNKVFSTINSESWDGKINGNYCQPGVYMYEVHYLDFGQNNIVKRGDLTLIR